MATTDRAAPESGDPVLRIHLLGTGGPELTPDRQGAATLLEIAREKLLFDAGRGVFQRLYESRVDVTEVYRVFLTHLHSDHVEGLPGLWMTGWFLLGRNRPLEIWGPAGTRRMVEGMKEMFSHDVECRGGSSAKENLTNIIVHEFEEGVIYEANGIRVTAFAVEHCDGNPAFGFRIEHAGRSVAICGDTTFTENIVRYASGVDVIVQNVIGASDDYLLQFPRKMRVIRKLATPEQNAEIFRRSEPRLAIYTHVIKLGVTETELLERTRRAGYQGPLEIAVDRTVVEIGAQVRVIPPIPLDGLRDITGPEA